MSDSLKLENSVDLQSVLEQRAGVRVCGCVCRQGEILLACGPVLTEKLQLPPCTPPLCPPPQRVSYLWIHLTHKDQSSSSSFLRSRTDLSTKFQSRDLRNENRRIQYFCCAPTFSYSQFWIVSVQFCNRPRIKFSDRSKKL